MTNEKIRTLEDLHREKRLLHLEIKATEQLILHSLHVSKDHLLEGAAESFFTLLRSEPLGSHDFTGIMNLADGEERKWWQKLIPFVPLALKIVGSIYETRKSRKRTVKSRESEVVLHRAAS